MRATPLIVAALTACGQGASAPDADQPGVPSPALVRAERRAYDGAPPTVPHPDPGAQCSACHDADGQAVGPAYAPASPHAETAIAGATRRCRQCHAFVTTDQVFTDNGFIGLPQNMRRGTRATPGAPPTIPHRLLMRERCVACHAGPGARDGIRTSHPERSRCRQCHVAVMVLNEFTTAETGQGDEQ
jgi:cytochrome c-type protein NapB